MITSLPRACDGILLLLLVYYSCDYFHHHHDVDGGGRRIGKLEQEERSLDQPRPPYIIYLILKHRAAGSQARQFTMAFALRPPSPRISLSVPVEGYDSSSSTDSEATPRAHTRSRTSFLTSRSNPRSDFLFPPALQSGRSSVSSTATSTPLASRSTSPLPQFYSSNPSSSCTSDTDSEPASPLLRSTRNLWWRENRRRWWTISRRRRRRGGRIVRMMKKWTRRLVRHPFFPSQPITIVSLFHIAYCWMTALTIWIGLDSNSALYLCHFFDSFAYLYPQS